MEANKSSAVHAQQNDISDVRQRIESLLDELVSHGGYGQMEIFTRLLNKGQKEIIVRCGKEYRYVIGKHKARGIPSQHAEPENNK